MESKKILICLQTTALRKEKITGGAPRLMINIAEALEESNWDVEFICPKSPDENTVKVDHKIHEFNFEEPNSMVTKITSSIRGYKLFHKLLRDKHYDIILDDISHIPYYPAHFFTSKSTVNATFMHTAFFRHAQEYTGFLRGTMIEFIDRSLPYLRSPEIICAGTSTRQRIHEKTGYKNTSILNPVVNTNSFNYTFDPSARRVLYLGRLTERKNAKILVKAWKRAKNTDEYLLSIAGTGSQLPELKRTAEKLDIENIEFLGYVSESEKIELFENSLLFVLPSKMEGYATTGLEALAGGTPVIGSDTYGINDYISDWETGILFQNRNSDDLAQKLDIALADPKQLEPLALNGRELAEEHSFERFSSKASELFTKISKRSC